MYGWEGLGAVLGAKTSFPGPSTYGRRPSGKRQLGRARFKFFYLKGVRVVRRLAARPSGVSLSATGRLSP